MRASEAKLQLQHLSGSSMPSLGVEEVRIVGVVRTIAQAAEPADAARPALLEVRLRCTESHSSAGRAILIWEAAQILWRSVDRDGHESSSGGALGSRECPFELRVPANIDATIYRARRTTKEQNLRWSLEAGQFALLGDKLDFVLADNMPRTRLAVLRYSAPSDGSRPRKATRQRIDLGLALHQEVPSSEMRSKPASPVDELEPDRTIRPAEVGAARPGRQVFQSLRASELSGQRSASTSRIETASQRTISTSVQAEAATELVVRCRFAPSLTSSASLIVTQRPLPSACSSYDSGYASTTPAPGSRCSSMRGHLRSAKPDAPAPVTEEGDGESSPSLAKARPDKPVNRQAHPTQHLSWASGDEPTPSTSPSTTRRSSRRPSTAPSLDRDPLWLPPAFGTSSPRAAAA
jgi:hypothetical protein